MSVFDSLIGQDHIVDQLSNAAKVAKTGEDSQAMTHSWLFVGPPGSGRSKLLLLSLQLSCVRKVVVGNVLIAPQSCRQLM